MVHQQEKKGENSLTIQFNDLGQSVQQEVVERKTSDGFHSTYLFGYDLTSFSAAVQVRIQQKFPYVKCKCT
jgi:hypothetical protein